VDRRHYLARNVLSAEGIKARAGLAKTLCEIFSGRPSAST
jgi:hypothetical protein